MAEKNIVIRDWSLKTQKAKGDSLTEGCISNLPEQVTSNARQNNLEDLTRIWKQWDSDTRSIFTKKYRDIAHLIAVNIDEQLIQAMEDMTPTIEEYAALLRIDNVQFSKIYVKEPKPMTFKKKLVRLMGMIDIYCEEDESICFGHLWINCLPKGSRACISCGSGFLRKLLNVWILSHFWKVERTPFHMFSKTFTPLKAYLEKDWPKDVNEQHWASVFQNLRAEEIT
ncbi:hypothetical protein CXB51_009225 [Gossypium anomalum]|uniref:Uncharacterized protein n=1 Tax=Gossypium anomalum TaxID=47600 RepID=A0A8J6D789_9ROSI|nr:hypothetical protein CXB51_009225 [Gossypium anomalum]